MLTHTFSVIEMVDNELKNKIQKAKPCTKRKEKKVMFFGVFFFLTETVVSESWQLECCDPLFHLFDLQIFLPGGDCDPN